jgi:hypothetical protein
MEQHSTTVDMAWLGAAACMDASGLATKGAPTDKLPQGTLTGGRASAMEGVGDADMGLRHKPSPGILSPQDLGLHDAAPWWRPPVPTPSTRRVGAPSPAGSRSET